MTDVIATKEHYDLMAQFERVYKGLRFDREVDKNLWKMGYVYQSPETNKLFLAFRMGYSYGKVA